ncbi:MAG: 50S ribosomal protein L30 [Candidatus Asgardarchaeia archaeon]
MLAVIRIRGTVNVRKDVSDTLLMLRLKRVNNCVIIPETPQYLGMLKKVRGMVTWGEIDVKTLSRLLQERGKVIEGKRLDEKSLKEITGFESFDEFAKALVKGKVKLKDFKKIKPVFKLNPPRHGFKSIRLYYPKGDLGDRGKDINQLLERMI